MAFLGSRSLGWNRGPVAAFIALAAACLIVGCRASQPAPAAVSPDTWAVVNGQSITRDSVEKAFRRVGDASQPLSEDEALAAKLGILDDLIIQEILLAKARELKLEVTEAEVDAAFGEAKKDIADDAFQQELTKRNLTAADMRDGLRRELLSQKLIEREVGAKISVADQEVTDFFNANRAQFNLPEDAYHLAQIVVTPVRDAQLVNRTGDDATTPQAAAAKVAMLMERLKGGAPFGDLAMDYSEDPESTPRGGDLGLVPLSAVKQASPALRDAVLKVTPGSARVVSEGGAYSIVFLVAVERAGQRDLSMPEVRQRITETLRGRKEQLLRTAYLAAARADADVVNYLARQVVESRSGAAGAQPAQPN
jgi:peptidyl-prolyl cis-trans isomerase SurA